MPRTKRPVRKQEKAVENDDALIKLNKLVFDQKKNIDSMADAEQRHVAIAFTILLKSINAQYLNKTVGQLKTELNLKEPQPKPTRHSSRAASHDDGYLTENSSQGSGEKRSNKKFVPPSATRTTSRRSRSADASARSIKTVSRANTHRRRSQSLYKTPIYTKNAPVTYPAITPKVTPHTSLTVLRQPRQGEMVVSMSGSPVMVPTCYTMQSEEKANCNILLQDGTMLSLQPKQLRQSQAYIPFSLMDSNVLHQIRTLKDNLEKVVKLGEKAIVK